MELLYNAAGLNDVITVTGAPFEGCPTLLKVSTAIGGPSQPFRFVMSGLVSVKISVSQVHVPDKLDPPLSGTKEP